VYEQFFQRFSPAIADTHGIVYTPREIVDYMCNAVERALKEEFGYTLASPEVVILDPCTGTGNFIVNLIERMPGKALAEAYKKRLFANELMLLPYYIASLNIEHAYYEKRKEYEPFEGLCFVDTLDMADAQQMGLFTAANTARVGREKKAAITVIIGNPPYNAGQKSENDNNKNRKYAVVDERVRQTYGKDSEATNTRALSDMYVKFFRWATDRLQGRDGIICFVSNNSFVDQLAFDGMRKHLLQDFDRIEHIDLHGNVRLNPKLSGTTHNVFGIQVGVGITVAVRRRGIAPALRYHRVPETWRKGQKLDFLGETNIPWQELAPGAGNAWLRLAHADEVADLARIDELFDLHGRGLESTRDEVVYDWNVEKLQARMKSFATAYNAEVDRYHREGNEAWPDRVKWSSSLKQYLIAHKYINFAEGSVRTCLWRPFAKKFVYFDPLVIHRIGMWPNVSGRSLCVTSHSQAPFSALATDGLPEHAVGSRAGQCFPLSHLNDSAVARFRQHYSDDSITKEQIFHYIYALLHHPGYRERYAANLKRELPRIPFAPDFAAFAAAGAELARLHVDYETLDPWPFESVETKDVPYSEHVTKMKLSADHQSLRVNDSLALASIPPATFDYRLGSRSALEWVIDQYQVKGESDPNREDDPGYIVRLVGQVVRVSVETGRIVDGLPDYR
jgi:predicted helicase